MEREAKVTAHGDKLHLTVLAVSGKAVLSAWGYHLRLTMRSEAEESRADDWFAEYGAEQQTTHYTPSYLISTSPCRDTTCIQTFRWTYSTCLNFSMMHLLIAIPVTDSSDKFKIPRKVPSGLGMAKIMLAVMSWRHGRGPTRQSVRCHLRKAL